MEERIAIEQVSFGYTKEPVLTNINLTVQSGEFICLVGENGSGKSTLIKLMLGVEKPQAGAVRLMGTEVAKLTSFKEIGYVPQVNAVNKISFPITVTELVTLGLYEDFGWVKIPRRRHRTQAKDKLAQMGLSAYVNTPFNELSGGLQQRCMITRALINNPKILILDEPTAGVDQASKVAFLELLNNLHQQGDITIVLVSHEVDLVQQYISLDKVYRISEGGLVDARV